MLDWFTTIPGILIICGVILLVIAIILFILGAKKSKKEETIITPTVQDNASPVVNETNNIDVTPIAPVVEESVVTPNVDTTVNVENVNTEVPTVEPVIINEPEIVNIPVEEPVVETPSVDEATSVINIPDMEVSTEEMNPIKIEDDSTIYGGETPVVDFTTQEEKPVTIYGGNDPLDATQTLPKMEENHVPYGGSYPEVRIVEPTVEEAVPTPVEETVFQMPTVEPVIINEPEIVNIPVEETVAVESSVVTNEVNTEEQAPAVEEL